MTPGQIEKLSLFLDALDEWGCEDNDERAKEIAAFIAGGFDLSEYEERPRLELVRPSEERQMTCRHADWSFAKHGRGCVTCGTILADFGD